MTQEEKDLLLRDLCARLPYGVKVYFKGEIALLFSVSPTQGFPITLDKTPTKGGGILNVSEEEIREVKPYLRPLSSMTEEERNEMSSIISPQGSAIYYNEYIGIPLTHLAQQIPYAYIAIVIDWLNKKMFDYRGLIPKDLAISTEVFNPYKY